MERIDRIAEAVSQLDAQARSELASAVTEGRFDEVAALTPLAKAIAEIASKWKRCLNGSYTTEDAGRHASDEQTSGAQTFDDTKRERQIGHGSPQFIREKDTLIKIGWSPQKNGAYEHRVPKEILDVTCHAVSTLGKSGYRFKIDEVLEKVQKGLGRKEVPSYQIYAIISWLKWAGMIIQHGRQGYTVVRPQTFTSSIETAWMALPHR